MKSTLFTTLAALSFLFFAVAIAVQFSHENEWYVGRHQIYRCDDRTFGWITYDSSTRENLGYPPPTFQVLKKKPFGVIYHPYRDVNYNVLGIRIRYIDEAGQRYGPHARPEPLPSSVNRYRIITIPPLHWTAALLFLPTSWLILHARQWHCRRIAAFRRKLHLCPHCAYDLRATPTRCPECGTVPSTPP